MATRPRPGPSSSSHKQDDDVDEQQADEDEAEVDEEVLHVLLSLLGNLHGGRPPDGRTGYVLHLLHSMLALYTHCAEAEVHTHTQMGREGDREKERCRSAEG